MLILQSTFLWKAAMSDCITANPTDCQALDKHSECFLRCFHVTHLLIVVRCLTSLERAVMDGLILLMFWAGDPIVSSHFTGLAEQGESQTHIQLCELNLSRLASALAGTFPHSEKGLYASVCDLGCWLCYWQLFCPLFYLNWDCNSGLCLRHRLAGVVCCIHHIYQRNESNSAMLCASSRKLRQFSRSFNNRVHSKHLCMQLNHMPDWFWLIGVYQQHTWIRKKSRVYVLFDKSGTMC